MTIYKLLDFNFISKFIHFLKKELIFGNFKKPPSCRKKIKPLSKYTHIHTYIHAFIIGMNTYESTDMSMRLRVETYAEETVEIHWRLRAARGPA